MVLAMSRKVLVSLLSEYYNETWTTIILKLDPSIGPPPTLGTNKGGTPLAHFYLGIESSIYGMIEASTIKMEYISTLTNDI